MTLANIWVIFNDLLFQVLLVLFHNWIRENLPGSLSSEGQVNIMTVGYCVDVYWSEEKWFSLLNSMLSFFTWGNIDNHSKYNISAYQASEFQISIVSVSLPVSLIHHLQGRKMNKPLTTIMCINKVALSETP